MNEELQTLRDVYTRNWSLDRKVRNLTAELAVERRITRTLWVASWVMVVLAVWGWCR